MLRSGIPIDADNATHSTRFSAHILPVMVPEALRLHTAFVSVLSEYTTALFAERGYPLDRRSVASIGEATAVLDDALAFELDLPFLEQRRSPMEIVRLALAIPGQALSDADVIPHDPSGGGSPDDPYGLAPGSSAALGREAHEAHLRWGVAKAEAFAEGLAPRPEHPTAVLMAPDRADRETLVAAIERHGFRCEVARNPGAVVAALDAGHVAAAIVDLEHRSARDAIARLTARAVMTVVYGDAIDDLTETGLRAQGVREVVDRRRLLADPSAFLPLIT